MTMVAGALFFFAVSTFFKGSGCTGKETDPGYLVADEFCLGRAISKKGGASFVFAAAPAFFYRPAASGGLYPVIVH